MAAARTDPATRGARHAAPWVAGSACALLASGAAALVMRAGFSQHANALWMSALTLATMMIAPTLMARSSDRRRWLPIAATLMVTMSAMSLVPPYLSGAEHGGAIAALMTATGGALLVDWRRVLGSANESLSESPDDPRQTADDSSTVLHTTGAAALLAFLAGVSSGSLARFQLYAICGVTGAQPIWQGALLLTAVCVLAFAAERSGQHRLLIALYVIRAALVGWLTAADTPTLAPLAAQVFLVLDCLTIPALMNLGSKPSRAFSASCPGAAHHIGMVSGAALSTTPYFFGDGFMVFYALSAAANLLCAAALTRNRRSETAIRQRLKQKHCRRHTEGKTQGNLTSATPDQLRWRQAP
ncbi:hypothetical protein [Paraburkholderia lacunae]|uniref:MFS transporter n=1 Tax=Paraburkholderia lacunae TaxID=2211104 RepID=A0A370N219_9BURK|nr:hypothetical protein [Paraburkholderia lacunae]RDJ99672.1 hypothetical protein DLM46_27585 [Paraburkholderia lacunae]